MLNNNMADVVILANYALNIWNGIYMVYMEYCCPSCGKHFGISHHSPCFVEKERYLLSFNIPGLGSKREVSRNLRKGKNFREINSLKSTREQEAKIIISTDIPKRNQL